MNKRHPPKEINIRLLQNLDKASAVRVDYTRRMILVWTGGHEIRALNYRGVEVSKWTVGSFIRDHATAIEVNTSMQTHIEEGSYP